MSTAPSISASTYKSLLAKVNRVIDIMEALLGTPPPPERWPDWLERITAILAQYETIARDLARPSLEATLLLPGMAMEASPSPEYVPNVLLRTRLAPEVEERLQELTSGNEGRKASSRLWAAMAQIMSEGVESLRTPTKPRVASGNPPPIVTAEDEQVVRAIRQFYTLCT